MVCGLFEVKFLEKRNLLLFLVIHVATDHRIVLAKLDTIGRVALVFHGVIDVGAFATFELYLHTRCGFSHGSVSFRRNGGISPE
jgi:hypothetical protein